MLVGVEHGPGSVVVGTVVVVLFSGTKFTVAATPEYVTDPSLENVTTKLDPLPVTGPGTVVRSPLV